MKLKSRKEVLPMKRLLFIALLSIPLAVSGGGPKRVQQTLCYDWDAATGICGSTVTIYTHPSELRGRIHRADTLRQIRGADMGYTAMTGRIVDDGGGCNLGDPACATCKTKFAITGNMTGCDSACVDCTVRSPR